MMKELMLGVSEFFTRKGHETMAVHESRKEGEIPRATMEVFIKPEGGLVKFEANYDDRFANYEFVATLEEFTTPLKNRTHYKLVVQDFVDSLKTDFGPKEQDFVNNTCLGMYEDILMLARAAHLGVKTLELTEATNRLNLG